MESDKEYFMHNLKQADRENTTNAGHFYVEFLIYCLLLNNFNLALYDKVACTWGREGKSRYGSYYVFLIDIFKRSSKNNCMS